MRKLSVIAAVIVAAQVLLTLASWMISSVMPDVGVRSMLSSEGIRRFFGHFSDSIASPLMLWIILLFMAWGTLKASGIHHALTPLRHRNRITLRQRYALWMSLTVFTVCLLVMIALTCLPHAILLSTTGRLFPSSFSASIIPVIAAVAMLMAIVYGTVSGTLRSIADIFKAITGNVSYLAPVLLIYILAAQLYFSLVFVLK